MLYPALSGGASYDLHENCFLVPLVLWLLYAVDTRRTVLAALTAVLLLCVKEDAAMYAAVIALWEMILAPTWTAIFLHEYPSLMVIVGFVIIIAGIFVDAKVDSPAKA